MKNVLIISGHTDLATSVANKTILETLANRLPKAEIVKLDELYPDFKTATLDPCRHHRVAVSRVLVLRALHSGALDGRNLPARFLPRQHGRQTERQEAHTVFYHGCARSDV